jgi:hypothetical protein
MWYKNLLRTDNGLKPQIVRVTEEIDKGIKHRRDIANPSHGMPLFPLGRACSILLFSITVCTMQT